MSGTDATRGPIINIRGRTVALGPLDRAYLPLYTRWSNDFAVGRHFYDRLEPVTLGRHEAWYAKVTEADDRVVRFTVFELATLRPIGRASLQDIDHLHRRASFGLMIGERDAWGKGYGTEATALMLDYAFNTLGLHNVMLQVVSANERAIRAYLRAGFREFGRRREARLDRGELVDDVFMECLSTEFTSPFTDA